MQFGRVGSAVVDADLDQHVLRRCFGILDEDVEVAILVENARVDQFVFEVLAARLRLVLTRSS